MNDVFVVRACSKKELALMYFPHTDAPHTAVNHLMSWIKRCKPLCGQLQRQGYNTSAKFFTAIQVETIVSYLGPPG